MKSCRRCRAWSHLATVPPSLDSALMAGRISVGRGGADWGYDMASIGCATSSCADISCADISHVDIKADRIRLDPSLLSAARVRNVTRLLAIALAGALLAACAQSSVVTRNSGFVGGR